MVGSFASLSRIVRTTVPTGTATHLATLRLKELTKDAGTLFGKNARRDLGAMWQATITYHIP
jgi:hypothetical protein